MNKLNSTLYFPKSRQKGLVIQESGDEILTYDFRNNNTCCLNKTSAQIWQLCDGNNSVAQISLKLSQKLKQKVSEDLIWLALDQLRRKNLLRDDVEISSNLIGFSRRELIKKAGFASMVALPVISSIIVPVAINAASTCLTENTCCSGFGCATSGRACCSGLNCRASTQSCQTCESQGTTIGTGCNGTQADCQFLCSQSNNLCCSNSSNAVLQANGTYDCICT